MWALFFCGTRTFAVLMHIWLCLAIFTNGHPSMWLVNWQLTSDANIPWAIKNIWLKNRRDLFACMPTMREEIRRILNFRFREHIFEKMASTINDHLFILIYFPVFVTHIRLDRNWSKNVHVKFLSLLSTIFGLGGFTKKFSRQIDLCR